MPRLEDFGATALNGHLTEVDFIILGMTTRHHERYLRLASDDPRRRFVERVFASLKDTKDLERVLEELDAVGFRI